MKHVLENQENLFIIQDIVEELIIEGGTVTGVRTLRNIEHYARAVIICTGTFLKGLIHIGEFQQHSGRLADFSSEGLSDSLRKAGLTVQRLKKPGPLPGSAQIQSISANVRHNTLTKHHSLSLIQLRKLLLSKYHAGLHTLPKKRIQLLKTIFTVRLCMAEK